MKKTITSWRDLSNVLIEAGLMSDPATCDPVGTAEYVQVGELVVRIHIEIDLVPTGQQIGE